MAKAAKAVFYDNGLAGLESTVNVMHICSAEPADYAGIAAVSLGSVAMAAGDFTLSSPGGGTGRRCAVAAKTITGSATGTGNHIVLADSVGEDLWVVTTTPDIGITNTEDQDFKAWNINMADPT